MVQFRLLPQPAGRLLRRQQRVIRPFILGTQPGQITAGGGTHHIAIAAPRREQPGGGKQRHLRVVGNRANALITGGKGGDARCAKVAEDVGAGHEFDRRAEGIACRPGEQAATEALLWGDVSHDGSL